ncbi:rhomboid family intramembrane serine protease [Ruixingdingia sedimenti]|uniref:Rhomboid family intramembrane serine protease n=1 Tax=Ruixingdingia sedimenti TaxID=3073604 RepID=A0ABU1F507_9RHOB|nr:rhomboid family intramembrane serine protease [Xinfangfangia sp. LG-4]MDR5651952.1 rhomboid family intramembrane serine protease [Xinfangfangia sp. LG-4]
MFPIRDHNPSGRTPFVTYLLIALNVAVFLSYWPFQDTPEAEYRVFLEWGVVPRLVAGGEGWQTLATSMFLHGDLFHLAGNMLFLWIFGDNMEDALGHVRFVLFYLASGVAAAVLQVAADPGSGIPMVGASGAIAGVLGGYLLFFPRARVDVLIIIVIFFRIVPVPAWLMLGLWLLFQVVNGLAADTDMGGVAYWAHAGGFAAGMLLVLPVWLARGGPAFWRRTEGAPPHPEAQYRRSPIPPVKRRR